ncbi:hypothetical protein QYE76_057433 [Lolium multiflorum]|uniref:Nucleotide-diphospho-sugar transferase domain-containing protein n=1 Tax=Lolium multiflorum TaxID=4521 RepID=A0AAD8T460_LOLMU|nr:hypothetical protein QYE76_057433 [Lolium multiflorum]
MEMLRRWRAARWRFPRDHEQTIFNQINHELAAADGGLRLRFQFLDTAIFGGFCRVFRNNMARACTMHANCYFGLGNKLTDLRDVLGQWKNYTAMTPLGRRNAKAAGRSFGWRVPARAGPGPWQGWAVAKGPGLGGGPRWRPFLYAIWAGK